MSINNKIIHMKIKNVNSQFGMRNGRIVDIEDIQECERGLKCNCVCPSCKTPLQAKLGHGKRIKHFAHNNADCNSEIAKQTALHYLAKEILEVNKCIVLPKYLITDSGKYKKISDEARIEIEKPYLVFQEKLIKFDKVYLEKRIDEIIPDVILEIDGKQLIVEVAVTHFVDNMKKEKIKKINISAIEINLSHLHQGEINRNKLENDIIRNTENKHRIYNTHYHKKMKILKRRNKSIIEKDYENQKKIEMENRIANEKRRIKEQKNIEFNQRAKVEIAKALELNNYQNIVTGLRDNHKTDEFLLTTSFYNRDEPKFPFFLDIPIRGEIAFRCDRRIWQSVVFDKFIYNRSSDEIVLAKITSWIFNHNDRFEINKILAKKVYIEKESIETSLVYEAISVFLFYLSLIGFIECSGRLLYHENYKIISKTLIPPNEETSRKFKEILKLNKILIPDIDKTILNEIHMRNLISQKRLSNNDYCDDSIYYKYAHSMNNDSMSDEVIKLSKIKDKEEKKEYEIRKKEEQINGYNEIIKIFDRNAEEVFRDSFGYRWIYCEICGKIKVEDDMTIYQYATGECSECRKRARAKHDL